MTPHGDDERQGAALLFDTLSAALPPELVEVQREGRWRARLAGREPAVLSVSVLLGDHRFELARDDRRRPASARIRHESGGVVLCTRTVGLDEWRAGLAARLADLARSNAAAAAALQQLAG